MDDWTLKYENSKAGELYREKEKLKKEAEDRHWRQRNEDFRREQRERHDRAMQREAEYERQANMEHLMEEMNNYLLEAEWLRLCIKFGVNPQPLKVLERTEETE